MIHAFKRLHRGAAAVATTAAPTWRRHFHQAAETPAVLALSRSKLLDALLSDLYQHPQHHSQHGHHHPHANEHTKADDIQFAHQIRHVCRGLAAVMGRTYDVVFEEMSADYAILNPLAPATDVSRFSDEEVQRAEARLMKMIAAALTRANFCVLSKDDFDAVEALQRPFLPIDIEWKRVSGSLRTMVDPYTSSGVEAPDFADRLLVFYRGTGTMSTTGFYYSDKMDELFARMINRIQRWFRPKQHEERQQVVARSLGSLQHRGLRHIHNMGDWLTRVTLVEPTLQSLFIIHREPDKRVRTSSEISTSVRNLYSNVKGSLRGKAKHAKKPADKPAPEPPEPRILGPLLQPTEASIENEEAFADTATEKWQSQATDPTNRLAHPLLQMSEEYGDFGVPLFKDPNATVQRRTVHIRGFRDVPIADLQLGFPALDISMKGLDRIRLVLFSAAGFGVAAQVAATEVVSWSGVVALSSLVLLITRMWFRYQVARVYVEHRAVNQSAEKLSSSHHAALADLVAEAADQEIKSLVTVYAALGTLTRHAPQGRWFTPHDIKGQCELLLHTKAGTSGAFNTAIPLRTLTRLKVIEARVAGADEETSPDGALEYRLVSWAEADRQLRTIWAQALHTPI